MRRRAVFSILFILLSAAPAHAHGVLEASSPEDGARVAKTPREVRVTLTEPPAKGSTMSVRDGCGRNVASEPRIEGSDLIAAIDGAEPGPWKVKIRSISSVDGHAVGAKLAFAVKGPRDCNRDEPPTDDESPPKVSSKPPIAGGDGDDGTSFPIVPVAVGTVVLVGLALVARRASSG